MDLKNWINLIQSRFFKSRFRLSFWDQEDSTVCQWFDWLDFNKFISSDTIATDGDAAGHQQHINLSTLIASKKSTENQTTF